MIRAILDWFKGLNAQYFSEWQRGYLHALDNRAIPTGASPDYWAGREIGARIRWRTGCGMTGNDP
jgi:hypothetical protein